MHSNGHPTYQDCEEIRSFVGRNVHSHLKLHTPHRMRETTIVLVSEEVAVKLLQEKDFTVKVEGWSRRRKLHLRGQRLILEVAMKDCMCSTCIKRFASVLFSMRDRGIAYEAGSWNGDCSIKFENPEGFNQADICNFLTENIGLTISDIEEVQVEKSE